MRVFLPYDIKYIPLYVQVQNYTRIDSVFARVVPPNWIPTIPPPSQEGTMGYDIGTNWIEMFDHNGDGNYTGPEGGQIPVPSNFTRGDYKVNIIVKGESGGYAAPVSTYWTVNDDGNPPTDTTNPTVQIINPGNGETISEMVNITAEADDDQGLNRIEIYVDGALKKTETMPDYYPYPQAIYGLDPNQIGYGQHTITAKAVDNNNNSATSSITINIEGIPGFEFNIVIIGCILTILTTIVLKKRKEIPKII